MVKIIRLDIKKGQKMNIVVLKGNLTKNIELRYTPQGTAVGKSSIAITDGYGDSQKTYFFDLTFWGKTAEMVNQHFQKGSQILINGRLQQETWTNQQEQKKQKISVIVEKVEFCGNKSNNNQTNNYQNQGNYRQNTPQQSNNYQANKYDLDEEDIPF